MYPKILNAKGEVVTLTPQQDSRAKYWEGVIKNALGYDVSITTLTQVLKAVSEQKFYRLPPAKYMPVIVGEGMAYSTNLEVFRSFKIGDDFATGLLNQGGNNARLAVADAGVDALNIKVFPWGKQIGWSILELEYASRVGNWDLITEKEASRKENWDLGIQKLSFLGLSGNTACTGLLNQTGVTVNTALITAPISVTATASSQNFSTVVQGILAAYRANSNHTTWPTHFVVPESDYLGMAAPSSPTYPLKSILQVLLETFRTMTMNENFQILPCAYAGAALSGASYQNYALYNADLKSMRLNIPLPYTNTIASTLDGFSFQNVGYGQFTGLLVQRPLELMYFQFPSSGTAN